MERRKNNIRIIRKLFGLPNDKCHCFGAYNLEYTCSVSNCEYKKYCKNISFVPQGIIFDSEYKIWIEEILKNETE